MPDNGNAGADAETVEVVRAEPAEAEPQLPPVSPPSTKAPVQFNQQVNVYQQIPQSAWDRLTADQVLDLSKRIIEQIDVADRRQFDYALEDAKAQQSGKRTAIWVGALIAIAGFAATLFLATHGHELIALSVSLPLATILAVVVGNRFLG